MNRKFAVAVALCVTFVVGNPLLAQPSKGLKLGQEYEFELGGDKKDINGLNINSYMMEIPISMKAGQTINVTATVLGKNRKVGLLVQDPKSAIIALTDQFFAVKTTKLLVEEVSATGNYKIFIYSDRIGVFTLRVNDPAAPANPEAEINALKTRVEQLRRELAAAELKLKSLLEKSRPR